MMKQFLEKDLTSANTVTFFSLRYKVIIAAPFYHYN